MSEYLKEIDLGYAQGPAPTRIVLEVVNGRVVVRSKLVLKQDPDAVVDLTEDDESSVEPGAPVTGTDEGSSVKEGATVPRSSVASDLEMSSSDEEAQDLPESVVSMPSLDDEPAVRTKSATKRKRAAEQDFEVVRKTTRPLIVTPQRKGDKPSQCWEVQTHNVQGKVVETPDLVEAPFKDPEVPPPRKRRAHKAASSATKPSSADAGPSSAGAEPSCSVAGTSSDAAPGRSKSPGTVKTIRECARHCKKFNLAPMNRDSVTSQNPKQMCPACGIQCSRLDMHVGCHRPDMDTDLIQSYATAHFTAKCRGPVFARRMAEEYVDEVISTLIERSELRGKPSPRIVTEAENKVCCRLSRDLALVGVAAGGLQGSIRTGDPKKLFKKRKQEQPATPFVEDESDSD